jgi:GWxTD domain-containing protein
MKLLETWVATPLAAALGWTLLHSLWEGALISAALAAVLLATRSPCARYVAACVAMLLVLGGFGVTLVNFLPEGVHGLRSPQLLVFASWNAPHSAASPSWSIQGLAVFVPWLAPLWIAGVWVFYVGYGAGWISVRRMRRRGVCCAPARWQKEIARLSARLRLSRPVLLLESSLADAPMVLGHFRPLILVPVAFLAGAPAEQIEVILLHELAHIRRCDYLVNVLQRALEGLLFYHPAVWWISRVIRVERENCCDDLVVAVSGNAHHYAVALTALERSRCSGREPAVAATGGRLVRRIHRILYPQTSSGAWTPWFAFLVLIATTSVAMAAWRSEPAQQSSGAAQAQTGNTETSRYSKWLNQDVVYIITAEERAAFLELTTDEERDKFIEQFWSRRNPTPGTLNNVFKEEHYRRIAYANGHFASPSGAPGWQSDRGHMYITSGPPDEIESYPTAKQRPYGWEVWTYRHGKGTVDKGPITFLFIDQTGTGDYHLLPVSAP